MDRPHAAAGKAPALVARAADGDHAERVAHLQRRAAGARRRAALAAALLCLSVVGWSTVALGPVPAVLAAVPTVLLGGVLVLGRRAVVAAADADARWAERSLAEPSAPGATPRVVGHAARPDDSGTELIPRVPREGASEVSRLATGPDVRRPAPVDLSSMLDDGPAAGDGAAPSADVEEAVAPDPVAAAPWVPVPVPRPAYTLKPAAPRREPAPLVVEEQATPAASVGVGSSATGPTGEQPAVAASPEPATGGYDLDAILARRRVVGE